MFNRLSITMIFKGYSGSEGNIMKIEMENLHRFKMEQEGPPLGVITNFVSQPDRDVKIKFTKR